ncbi:MAG: hypothetical protein MI757_17615, partial [Pirellulales bacterium]|nr:hypothetical protein [Pirellulales bacterium]
MSTTDKNSDAAQLKDVLYRDYNRGKAWQQRLHREAVHKALDIAPEDDVHISQKTSGLGWRELALIILGMVAATAASGWFFSQSAKPPAPPTDSEYNVRFYDKDGKLIDVPHIGQ